MRRITPWLLAAVGTLAIGTIPARADNRNDAAHPGSPSECPTKTEGLRPCNPIASIALTARFPDISPHKAVRFSVTTFSLDITNAGSPTAFTFSTRDAFTALVRPNSSAALLYETSSIPRPESRRDLQLWRAAGSPRNVTRAEAMHASTVPAGTYTFAPQGKTITFSAAATLPTNPGRLRASLLSDLESRYGSDVPAAASLRQYGYILAVSPLSRGGRRAALEALGGLRGVGTCGRPPKARLTLLTLCAAGPLTDTTVTISTATGVACSVAETLTRTSPLFPHVPVGATVDSAAFTLQGGSSGCPLRG
jgi:hypothetical protein